jgi:hypothetical protein
MKISFSRRQAAFLGSFIVIPAVLWATQVRPTLTERESFVERQAKAHVVQERNRLLPSQRDELTKAWTDFEPSATSALNNLANDLNPHLVQKRIFSTAQELGCRVKIARLASKDDANFMRFSLTGEGSYASLVKLVDQLEQGQHYVRFEKLGLEMPKAESAASARLVRMSGVLIIPAIAGVLEEATGQ